MNVIIAWIFLYLFDPQLETGFEKTVLSWCLFGKISGKKQGFHSSYLSMYIAEKRITAVSVFFFNIVQALVRIVWFLSVHTRPCAFPIVSDFADEVTELILRSNCVLHHLGWETRNYLVVLTRSYQVTMLADDHLKTNKMPKWVFIDRMLSWLICLRLDCGL